MKRLFVLLALVTTIVGFAMVLAAAVPAEPTSPFIGTWWATDTSDGSLEQVTFGAGGSLFFRDDSAHVCDGAAGFITDVGSVQGDTWTGSGSALLRCPADDSKTIGPLFVQFTLNPSGTLTGSLGPDVFTHTLP
jgi:hypothetical protein